MDGVTALVIATVNRVGYAVIPERLQSEQRTGTGLI